MVLTRIQLQAPISKLNNTNINQIDVDPVIYVLSPFDGILNPIDLHWIKLYLQEKNDIDKQDEKLDISISNTKYILDHFLSQAKSIYGNTLYSW